MDINIDNNSELIGSSRDFDERINAIRDQFFSALDDFKKYYVYFNKNPEVDEFQNYYATSKGQLQTMSRNIFQMTNNIDKNIEDLNNQMAIISLQLKKETEINEKLKSRLHSLENTQNGSEVLVDDSKTAYNIQFYKNWQMFIGIIGVTVLILKVYRKPVMPVAK